MIAITIGIGAYSAMAKRSAELINKYCGLKSYIANEQDLRKFRVAIPHFLKFYIFEIY